MIRVLGLIPARGGSKGVPRKNLKNLAGKPLIQYSIEAGRDSKLLSKLVVSTDDEEIANLSLNLGADVPFLRPANLAEDTTPTLPVIVHALKYYSDKGEHFDAVCLLQPTSPYRPSGLIDKCIKEFERTNTDSLVTLREVPAEYNPHWVFWLKENSELELATGEKKLIPRRQELPKAYHRDGSIYLSKTKVILDDNSLLGERISGYINDIEFDINIDTPEDWNHAVQVFEQLKQQEITN